MYFVAVGRRIREIEGTRAQELGPKIDRKTRRIRKGNQETIGRCQTIVRRQSRQADY